MAIVPGLALLSGRQSSGALTDCSAAIPWDEAWRYPGEERVVRGEVLTALAGFSAGDMSAADSLFIGVPGPSNWEEHWEQSWQQPTPSVELNEDGSARALVVNLPSESEEWAYWGKAICARGVIRPGSSTNHRWTFWPSLSVSSTEDIMIDE